VKTIDSTLKTVEEKWLQTLFTRCKEIFSQTYLPSHDESHHFRVWLFAKQLIRELEKANYSFDVNRIEKIILAIFFHDTGLSVEPGAEHGRFSRRFAGEFFKQSPVKPPDGLDEVLTVIEKHDDKEYAGTFAQPSASPDGLFLVVNASDDLDAFGITGIYRYAEIYLLREIQGKDLAIQVQENSAIRFRGFFSVYGFLGPFAEHQRIRYQILQKFYNDLIFQHKTGTVSKITGPSAVIQQIQQSVLEKKLPLKQLIREAETTSNDPYVLDFFRLLGDEVGDAMVIQ
jgi:HD superfamily phosphodiesterase